MDICPQSFLLHFPLSKNWQPLSNDLRISRKMKMIQFFFFFFALTHRITLIYFCPRISRVCLPLLLTIAADRMVAGDSIS